MNPVINPEAPHLGGNMPADADDGSSFWPELMRFLLDKLNPQSVLDVGCGTGRTLRWFHAHGLSVVGLEGLEENAEVCGVPVLIHDFQGMRSYTPRFTGIDLVWCVEVVEHIDAKYVDQLCAVLASGRYLAMTHALPGQGGYHHVNEQYVEYWFIKMMAAGLEPVPELTVQSRTIVPAGSFWARTGLIFKRKGT